MTTETKLCIECNKEPRASGRRKCKGCYNAYARWSRSAEGKAAIAAKKADAAALKARGLRRCSTCDDTKACTEFYGKRKQCDPCRKAMRSSQQKAYHEANRERELARKKIYREANREKIAAYYEANREAKLAQQKVYRQAHPEVRQRSNAKRKATLRKAEGSHTQEEWETVRDHYGRCVNPECKAPFAPPFAPLERDHVIPISQGGDNGPWNLQPLCKSCNATKGTQTIDYRVHWEPNPLQFKPYSSGELSLD